MTRVWAQEAEHDTVAGYEAKYRPRGRDTRWKDPKYIKRIIFADNCDPKRESQVAVVQNRRGTQARRNSMKHGVVSVVFVGALCMEGSERRSRVHDSSRQIVALMGTVGVAYWPSTDIRLRACGASRELGQRARGSAPCLLCFSAPLKDAAPGTLYPSDPRGVIAGRASPPRIST